MTTSPQLASMDLGTMVSDPVLKKRIQKYEKAIKFVTKISVLEQYQQMVHHDLTAESFWSKWLKHLQIRHERINNPSNSDPIPASGATVFLANHPFGMIDGIMFAALVRQIRSDVKIMANQALQAVAGLGADIIGVDPYNRSTSKKNNLASMREAVRWLKQDGALIVFPGGDVSCFDKKTRQTMDPPWNPVIGRIIVSARANVVPFYFYGKNSRLFYRLRKLDGRLGTLMLARECLKKRGHTLRYAIGEKVTFERLQTLHNPQAVIDYLFSETNQLAGRYHDKA